MEERVNVKFIISALDITLYFDFQVKTKVFEKQRKILSLIFKQGMHYREHFSNFQSRICIYIYIYIYTPVIQIC